MRSTEFLHPTDAYCASCAPKVSEVVRAEIARPSGPQWRPPSSAGDWHGELAAGIQEEHPDVMCNQAFISANPAIHPATAAVEILEDFAGARPDAVAIAEMVCVTEGQAGAAVTELMCVDGIAAGVSSAANVAVALSIAQRLARGPSTD